METISSVFNIYAPVKKKYIRPNEAPLISKNLYKEILKRSRLRKKYLKSKSLTDTKGYNIQQNLCKKLSRITKKEYYNNLNTKKVIDNENLLGNCCSSFFK